MDLSMGGGGGGGGGAGGCRYSAAFSSSTISLMFGMVVRFLGGSGTGTGAGTGTGMTEEGAERYPAVRGSLLVMVTMETAGITGGEMSD